MPAIARIFLSGLIGAIVCGILSLLMFFLLTIFDNQKVFDAFAYSLIVGMIAAFVGVIGGGVIGFLGTLIVVAIYVYSTAENSGQYGYFLSESRIILIVLALPTILTGVITALLKTALFRKKDL